MNEPSNENITINITRELTIDRVALVKILKILQAPANGEKTETSQDAAIVAKNVPEISREKSGTPRLAFTRRETAEVLGISPASVDRLAQRGLLRSSTALKKPLYSKFEIERFLKETMGSVL
ncbi:MAG TPA: hypothetical protein VN836_05900 [Verrucomicrobiae bacterium]|nr:hypothetical protein [Verrucomicrobiae bacterium]